MHDAKGRELKVGDIALIPVKISSLTPGETYCNVTVTSVYGRRPDGLKETISAINTGVLLRANPGDDATDIAEDGAESGEIVIGGTDLHVNTDPAIGGSGTDAGGKKPK